jgi:hypothetical protein
MSELNVSGALLLVRRVHEVIAFHAFRLSDMPPSIHSCICGQKRLLEHHRVIRAFLCSMHLSKLQIRESVVVAQTAGGNPEFPAHRPVQLRKSAAMGNDSILARDYKNAQLASAPYANGSANSSQ